MKLTTILFIIFSATPSYADFIELNTTLNLEECTTDMIKNECTFLQLQSKKIKVNFLKHNKGGVSGYGEINGVFRNESYKVGLIFYNDYRSTNLYVSRSSHEQEHVTG